MLITIISKELDSFCIEVTSESTVLNIKDSIFKLTGILPSNQRLVFKGKILVNNDILNDLKIVSMSKIHLVAKKKEKKISYVDDQMEVFEKLGLFSSENKTSELLESCDKLKKQFPNASHIVNDDETIKELLTIMRDPQSRLERYRSNDRIMDMNEMHIGGLREMLKHYNLVEKIIESVTDNPLEAKLNKTTIPEKPDCPSTTELPTNSTISVTIEQLFELLTLTQDIKEKPFGSIFSSIQRVKSKFENLNDDYSSNSNSFIQKFPSQNQIYKSPPQKPSEFDYSSDPDDDKTFSID